MVLVARSLPIIIVLVVKPLAHQRHIPRLRVRHFVPQLRSKRLNQSSRAHYVGISREMMLPVKTHRDVAGNVKPKRNIVLLAGRRVCGGELIQNLLADNGTKKFASGTSPTPSR